MRHWSGWLTAAAGWRVRCGSPTCSVCWSATSRTTESCGGRRPAASTSSASPPAFQTVSDREGRLVTCSHQGRCVLRTELDGEVTVLADSFEGKRPNSPNDVVVKSDGTIWFSDPPTASRPTTRAVGAISNNRRGSTGWTRARTR
ncbi:MAG: SMP-30/gluconolactonase/LRE family protein [Allosphingosinicella sp.]